MRAPSRRLATRLLLAMFALFWGESLVVTSCRMHSGTSTASAHQSHSSGEHAPANDPIPTPCRCLGDCLGSPTVAKVDASFELSFAEVQVTAAPLPSPATPAESPSQVRLPFAQGPPTRSIA